jgi:hypothetical protein
MDDSTAHFLVYELVGIGMLLSGFVGMTLWKDKGGSPSGGFIVGLLLGTSGRVHPRLGEAWAKGDRQGREIPRTIT